MTNKLSAEVERWVYFDRRPAGRVIHIAQTRQTSCKQTENPYLPTCRSPPFMLASNVLVLVQMKQIDQDSSVCVIC